MRQFFLYNRFFIVVGALGVFIRAMLALVVNYWWSRSGGDGLLPNSDEIGNYHVGERISHALHAGMSVAAPDVALSDPHIGYYHIIGWLIYLFDITPLGLRLLNAVIGVIPSMVFLILCREANLGQRAEKIFFTLAVLTPSIIFWNALVLKETSIYVLTSLVVLAGGRMVLHERVTVVDLLLCNIPLLALSVFRSYAALLLLSAVASICLLLAKDRLDSALVALTAVFCMTVFNPDVWKFVMPVLGYISPSLVPTLLGGGGYTGEAFVADIVGSLAVQGTVIPSDASRLSRFWLLFTFPLPWQVQTVFQAFAVPEIVLTLLLFPVTAYGVWLRVAARDKVAALFVVVGALFLCLYLYALSNLGTIYRMKSGLAMYFLYFTAAGLDTAWRKWRPEL